MTRETNGRKFQIIQIMRRYILVICTSIIILFSFTDFGNAVFRSVPNYEFEVVEAVEVGKAMVRYRAVGTKEWKTALIRFETRSDYSRGPNAPPLEKCDPRINMDDIALSVFRKLLPTRFTTRVLDWYYPANMPISAGRPAVVNLIAQMGEDILGIMEEAGLYCPRTRQ